MLLAGSAAAAVAGGAGARRRAQGRSRKAPGVYRHKLGDYQLTALYDGLWSLKIDDKFVRNANGAAVNKALAAAFLPPNILPVSFTVLLVNTGSKLDPDRRRHRRPDRRHRGLHDGQSRRRRRSHPRRSTPS